MSDKQEIIATQSRDMGLFYYRAIEALSTASWEAAQAVDLESALHCITHTTKEVLGDKQAYLRPGALKEGERQYSISGIFLLSRSGKENLLFAEVGFPKEQHRLRIPSTLGHPGWIVREKRPLLLANTDENTEFKQILKTSRMGSAVFAPISWKGRFIGQLLTACQARYTYCQKDLEVLIAFSNLAAAIYIANHGDDVCDALLQR